MFPGPGYPKGCSLHLPGPGHWLGRVIGPGLPLMGLLVRSYSRAAFYRVEGALHAFF